MAREFTDILSSGEVTEIFLGGTDPGDEVITLGELSDGSITSMFIGGTDPGDEVLTLDEIDTLLSGGSITSIFLGGTDPGDEVLTLDEITALLSDGSITSIFLGGTDPGDEVLTLDEITALIGGGSLDLHLTDSTALYCGTDDDMSVYHNGANGFISSGTGVLTILTSNSAALYLGTDGVARWGIDASGHILPYVNASYNIGSASYSTGDIFTGESKCHYFNEDLTRYVTAPSTSHFLMVNTLGQLQFFGQAGVLIEAGGTGSISWFLAPTSGDFYPSVDNSYSLGNATHCVNTVYYYSLSSCSDERLKTDIEDSLGLDFIEQLSAVSYRYDTQKVTGKVPSIRRYGLLAQQIETVVKGLDKEFEGVHYDEENDKYGLDYTQFIAPIIKAIQELKETVDDHTEELRGIRLSKPDNK